MTCAGIACFLLFGWLAAKAHNATANKAVSWLSGFSFTAFLLQHVVIIWVVDNVSYANVTLKTEALMLFVVFALILLWGLAVNWCGKRLKRWLRSRLLPAPTPKSAAPAPEQAA
jgi:peptidoglycan/LPS O-acetylase OafA/YrhL